MPWDDFEKRMRELAALQSAVQLIEWDQQTGCPPRGAAAAGERLGAVAAVHHERLCDDRLWELCERLSDDRGLAPPRAAMVRALRRDAARARRVPASWVRAKAEAQAAGLAAWEAARKERRFASFAGPLERLVALRREQGDLLREGPSRYDALLDLYEPGATRAVLDPLFGRLVPELRELAGAVGPSEPARFAGRFDLGRQWELSLSLVRAMGFDLDAGRLDRSTHPFSIGLHVTDVRLTNRFREEDPRPAIFGALHECGHGLYEQGFAPELAGTSLAAACSFGLHESQSRLWENGVGRSLPFWRAFFPKVRALFPEALSGHDERSFHRAVNEVRPSPVRVEADEVTYNLHIALRYRLEAGLVDGGLTPRELPGAWNDGMAELLSLRPKDDLEGVLQDIHWAIGEIGYFPSYTIGNLYAAVLLSAAERALPSLWEGVARGELLPLRDWLRAHVHGPGRTQDAEPTVRAAAGEGLGERPFLDYLWKKYGELYGARRR